uniref:Prominin 1a n=1 Tax=Gadus morhua TaxID=8049 RepID=A0A8C5BA99_GADMO
VAYTLHRDYTLDRDYTLQDYILQTVQGRLDFGSVPAGVYETLAHYEPGPIGILFSLVHAFLCVVQPNPFPQDLIVKLVKEKFGAPQTEYQKVLYYELGFLLCAAVGVVYLVLLPLAGLLLCICRCCDNCGGEMHQRQRKNADCQRGLLGTLLFTTSLVISIGVLCAYTANQTLSSQVKNVRRLVNSNMRDLHTFVNDTPTQIDFLVSQYSTAKGKVLYDLDNIGPLLGGRIHGQLGKEVRPAMDGALSLAGAMRETREALENASVSLEVLQEGSGKLAFSLSLMRSSLRRSLDDPACRDPKNQPTSAQLCSAIQSSLSHLHLHANYSRVRPTLIQRYCSNLSYVMQGYSSLNNTPSMVVDQTTSVVEGLLDGIGSNISSFSKGFPVRSSLANFTIFINQAHSSIEDHYPQLDQADFYRWAGCIALCCMLVLVLAFNYLGLLCGTLGYDKHASPTTRGCISNTGGTLLMAGVGFSFLFSWLLMGVVTAAFLVGGNLEKLLCEPYHSKELFKLLDTPHMVDPQWRNFIPGFLYNDSDLDLTVENLYSNCKENRGIYSAGRLDKIFNITAFLNTTLFTREVVSVLEGIRLDLGGVELLQAEGRQNLLDFSESGLSEINYAQYLEEVNKGVTVEDLLTFTSQLEAQTDLMPEGPLQTALKGHTSTLRQIHSQQVVPLEQAMSALNQSMRFLERTASDLPNKVLAVLNALDEAQYLISKNATQLTSQETKLYKDVIVGYFQQYIDWVKSSLALEVATCKPLSNMVDTTHILTFSFVLVLQQNTFWMGLGCSTLFLLPSIVLAVKLAKFYRRMETEDVYDENMKNLENMRKIRNLGNIRYTGNA